MFATIFYHRCNAVRSINGKRTADSMWCWEKKTTDKSYTNILNFLPEQVVSVQLDLAAVVAVAAAEHSFAVPVADYIAAVLDSATWGGSQVILHKRRAKPI